MHSISTLTIPLIQVHDGLLLNPWCRKLIVYQTSLSKSNVLRSGSDFPSLDSQRLPGSYLDENHFFWPKPFSHSRSFAGRRRRRLYSCPSSEINFTKLLLVYIQKIFENISVSYKIVTNIFGWTPAYAGFAFLAVLCNFGEGLCYV